MTMNPLSHAGLNGDQIARLASMQAIAQRGSPVANAIKTAIGLYAQDPNETRSFDERVGEVVDVLVTRFRGLDRDSQDQYLEGLGVEALLEQGHIAIPVAETPPVEGVDDLAAEKYADSVRADPRLVARLMRKAADGSAEVSRIDQQETLDNYFRRLAVEDFHKGFDGCEYPQLAEAARTLAAEEIEDQYEGQDEGIDSDMETRVSLFRQAAIYREREQAMNIARMVGGVADPSLLTIRAQPLPASEDDHVSLDALRLHIDEDGVVNGHEDDEGQIPRERGG